MIVLFSLAFSFVFNICSIVFVCNTGVIGGKFLERGRVKKPNQPMYSTQLSEYYQAQDLYVGASVTFNNHRFVLIDADEYAYNYMERHDTEVSFVLTQYLTVFLTFYFYQTLSMLHKNLILFF